MGQPYYATLHRFWAAISVKYPGWTLDEIKDLTPRERMNWLALATKR